MTPKPQGPRRRKLDCLALRQHVTHHPEATLKKRAQHFVVPINAIWYALQQVKVVHEKTLRYAERDPTKREASLHQLRHILTTQGGGQAGRSG